MNRQGRETCARVFTMAVVMSVATAWSTTSGAQSAPSSASQGSPSDVPGETTHEQAPASSTTTTTQATYDPVIERLERPEALPAPWKATPNRGLLITGGAMLVGAYATSALVGLGSSLGPDQKLAIPVIGPWLNLAERPCSLGGCGGRDDLPNALVFVSGITQAVGVGLALLSLAVPEKREPKKIEAGVRFTPMTFGRGGGVGAVGTF